MAVNWQKEPPTEAIGEAAVKSVDETPSDTRRGGDVRTLLSPKSVGAKSGFMGCATLAPGDKISEHWHPFSEEFIYCVRGTITAELDDEPQEVKAGEAALRPVHDAPPAQERGRRGGLHRLPPRPARAARGPRTRRHGVTSALRRTAVTGVGVVAPGGTDREAFWENITAGRTATRKISFFDPEGFRSQIAAEADFDPLAAGLTEHEIRRMDRYIQFAASSAMQAVEDSGLDLDAVDRERVAVTLGSAVGARWASRTATWPSPTTARTGSSTPTTRRPSSTTTSSRRASPARSR